MIRLLIWFCWSNGMDQHEVDTMEMKLIQKRVDLIIDSIVCESPFHLPISDWVCWKVLANFKQFISTDHMIPKAIWAW